MSQTKAQLIDGQGEINLGGLDIDASAPDGSVNLDSSGRLLVGTSSARGNLYGGYTARAQIEGTDFETAALSITCNNTTDINSGVISLNKSGGSTIGSNTIVSNGERLGSLRFQGNDGTNFIDGAYVLAEVDGTPGTNDMPCRLVFSTTADGASSPTERARILSQGQFAAFSDSSHAFLTARASNTTGTNMSFQASATDLDTATQTCAIRANGDIDNQNNSYGSLSDARLKENIVDANSQWEDLKAIQIRNYNYKLETNYNTHTQLGLIAQEVECISPGLVTDSIDETTGDTIKSIKYSVLYMKAVKALQEAMERIETLEAKVAALEAQ